MSKIPEVAHNPTKMFHKMKNKYMNNANKICIYAVEELQNSDK